MLILLRAFIKQINRILGVIYKKQKMHVNDF